MYKKLASPDASPVLGPATPSMNAKESPVIGPTASNASNGATNSANSTNEVIEPFSLYNCCCSPRNHDNKNNNNNNNNKPLVQEECPTQADKQPQMPENVNPKYEFGHATHYTYCKTTPRLICEFETGTPQSP
jgi:hypothetical protein